MKTARYVLMVVFALMTAAAMATPAVKEYVVKEYSVPGGSHPHDVVPAKDGGVWYTAQRSGALGWLDPKTGSTCHIPLGENSSPHGVIVGPDGAPWITDSGPNVIVRVDPKTVFTAPEGTPNMNLNTATFDNNGILWFTGQTGYYGRLNPANGEMKVFKAPHGRGPYGIATAPDGACITHLLPVHISRASTSRVARPTVIEPPTRDQGARRVWADSKGASG